MCEFKKDFNLMCRSIIINDDISYNIIRIRDELHAYVNISGYLTHMIVDSEDNVISWLKHENIRLFGIQLYTS